MQPGMSVSYVARRAGVAPVCYSTGDAECSKVACGRVLRRFAFQST
jgi:hypothetical protein